MTVSHAKLRLVHLGERWDEVHPGVNRKTASGERMTINVYDFGPGRKLPLHDHDQEQVTTVLDGSVTFATATSTETVGPGTVLFIPPGLPHDAVAGPNGARAITVLSPARVGATALTVMKSGRALATTKERPPAKKPRGRG